MSFGADQPTPPSGRAAATVTEPLRVITGLPGVPKTYPTTPDGRYFEVRGRLWRASRPDLSPEDRQQHVHDLMDARRAVKAARASGDAEDLRQARREVDRAKVALGERGPVWWTDGAPDYNRHMARNTPYADWYADLGSDTP